MTDTSLDTRLAINLRNELAVHLKGKNPDVVENALGLLVAAHIAAHKGDTPQATKAMRVALLMNFAKMVSGLVPLVEQMREQSRQTVN